MNKSFFQKKYFLSFLFLGVNLLIYGYGYGNNSYHDYLLPYINKIIDPSLYPRDIYLTTLKSFPSLYIYAIGYLGKIFPLENLHFIIYVIAKYLFFLAIYSLADFLFKNKSTALLAVFIFALSPLVNAFGLLGEEAVMKPLLYQTTLSIPFLLFVIYLFLKKKYFVSLSLLAILFFINGLLSLHLTVILFFGTLAVLTDKSRRGEKRGLLSSWLTFLILWLPYLVGL